MSLYTTQFLSWEGVTGATNYTVKYKLSSSGIWTTVDSSEIVGVGGSPVTCTITGLDYCTSYDFSIQSQCGLELSSPVIITGTTANNHSTYIYEKFSMETPVHNDESVNPYTNMIAVNNPVSNMSSSTAQLFIVDGHWYDNIGHALLCYYQDGTHFSTYTPVPLTASFWNNPTSLTTAGRGNAIGVAPANSCSSPVFPSMPDVSIGYTSGVSYGFNYTYYCNDISLIYIGIETSATACSYGLQVLIDGLLQLKITTTINSFNIYPLQFDPGSHIITIIHNMQNGTASVPTATIAVEIYNNTQAEITAASSISDLNVLFSTQQQFCKPFNIGSTLGWSCPIGYYLDTTDYLSAYDNSQLRCIKRV